MRALLAAIMCLSISTFVAVEAHGAGVSGKDVARLADRLDQLPSDIWTDNMWCVDGEAMVVELLADADATIADANTLPERSRVRRQVYGDGGLGLRTDRLRTSHARCKARLASTQTAKRLGAALSADGVTALEDLRAAGAIWTANGGTGSLPGLDEACERVVYTLLQIPDDWKQASTSDLDRRLAQDPTTAGCKPFDPTLATNLELERQLIGTLQKTRAAINEGRYPAAMAILTPVLTHWPKEVTVPRAEGLALGTELADRLTDETRTALERVEVAPSMSTLLGAQVALSALHNVEAWSNEKHRSAATDLAARVLAAESAVIENLVDRAAQETSVEGIRALRVTLSVVAESLEGNETKAQAAEALSGIDRRLPELERTARMRALFPTSDRAMPATTLSETALGVLYALADDNPALLAFHVMPNWRAKYDAAKDSEYQRDLLLKEAKTSRAVATEMRAWRAFVQDIEFLAVPPRERLVNTIPPELSYRDGQFVLKIGRANDMAGAEDWTRLSNTDLADGPACVSPGLWKHVRWVKDPYGWYDAEVVLRGLPHELKARIETDLGQALQFRWWWRGAGRAVYRRPIHLAGLVAAAACIEPSRLELVDTSGKVLWSIE